MRDATRIFILLLKKRTSALDAFRMLCSPRGWHASCNCDCARIADLDDAAAHILSILSFLSITTTVKTRCYSSMVDNYMRFVLFKSPKLTKTFELCHCCLLGRWHKSVAAVRHCRVSLGRKRLKARAQL
jgi:hypothetical protein